MADIFRIMGRFKITGRGTVYTIKSSKGSDLKVASCIIQSVESK